MSTQKRLERAFRLVYARRLEEARDLLNEAATSPEYGTTTPTVLMQLNTLAMASKAIQAMLVES